MIRFINLTGQILIDDDELHFAWFDTITDEFMQFSGSQAWHSWEDFKRDYIDSYGGETTFSLEGLERFEKLYQFKTSPTNSDPSLKE